MDATEQDPMSCGLSSAAASALQQQYGLNRLPTAHAPRWWQQLLAQFYNTLIAILLAAALLSLILGHLVDATVIGVVILINTMLGFVQENRAEKAMQALQSFLAPQALACRDGAWQHLPAEALVPGDWVRVENGARISADMRLLEAHALRVDESLLTGESVPVDKTTSGDTGERLLRAGTLVTGGNGVGQVTATGSATEIGRIHQLMGNTPTMRSPLLERISRLSRTLAFIVILLAAIAAGIAWWRGETLEFALLAAISLAVAIIPEGLPAVISVTLALGVQRMAQRGTIVRQLPAVETLGTVTVICTDKTGTLTENRMTVQDLTLADDSPDLLQRALQVMILCNDAQLHNDKGGIGDPLEQALLRYAGTHDADVDTLRMGSPRVDTRPFSHEQPFMATRHADGIAIKGAPEWVLQRCQRTATASGVAEVDPAYWHKVIADMATAGMRTIALASAVDGQWETLDDGGWTWLGVVALLDPPRAAVPAAIAACRSAGIRVIMVTGDHPQTAATIARQVGILEDGPAAVVDHAQWASADAGERQALARAAVVFARVQPADKLELVQTLQASGEVVAMTGDGVNDAPALRRAQIGVAMGKSGSDVAREAAAMVLSDDNFTHIATAVAEGRHIYDNIRRTTFFMLPTNFAQGLVIFFAVLSGMTLPITPLQILWVNTITASTLTLAFAFMGMDKGVMQRKPRPAREALIPGTLWWRIVGLSAFLVVTVFAVFFGDATLHSDSHAHTLAVNALVGMEAGILLAMYGRRRHDWGDVVLVTAMSAALVAQGLFSCLPFFQRVFATTAMGGADMGIIAVCAVLAWLAGKLATPPQAA